jgi:DNA repair protein RecO
MSARRGRSAALVGSDRALLLRRHPYGESSLVVHALGPRSGRLELLARGAYRPTSRFAFALDVFDTLEWTWQPRRGGLDLLVSAEVRVRRRHLTRALDAYRVGLAMLELVDLGTRPGTPEPTLFARLESGLDELDQGVALGVAPGPALLRFDSGVLGDLGLEPAWKHCASCGRAAPHARAGEQGRFSAAAGGRLCRVCAERWEAEGRPCIAVEARVFDLGAHLSESDPSPLRVADRRDRGTLRRLLDELLAWHLERPPRSRGRWRIGEHGASPSAAPSPSQTQPQPQPSSGRQRAGGA